MKLRALFVGLLTVLCGQVCAADAVALLKNFSFNAASVSGRFSQLSPENASELSSGRFSFSKPGKFLWQTEKPFKQTIVSDAKTLWIYDSDLNQVTVRDLKHSMNSGPAVLLSGGVDPETVFDLNDLGTKKDLSWVRAVPKGRENSFSALEIGFDSAGLPRQMRLEDQFGESTLYVLDPVNVPSKAGESVYEFKIPAEADVLKDTSSE